MIFSAFRKFLFLTVFCLSLPLTILGASSTWSAGSPDTPTEWDNTSNWFSGVPGTGLIDTASFAAFGITVFPSGSLGTATIPLEEIEFSLNPELMIIGPFDPAITLSGTPAKITSLLGDSTQKILGPVDLGTSDLTITTGLGNSIMIFGESGSQSLKSLNTVTITGSATAQFSGENSWASASEILTIDTDATLQITSVTGLGDGSGLTALETVAFNDNGVFQAGADNLVIEKTKFRIDSGTGIIDTQNFNVTVTSVIEDSTSETLEKKGTGTLFLQGTNTYREGTDLTEGKLNIKEDANLGSTTATLSIQGGATLQAGAGFSLVSTRPVTLDGSASIDTAGFNVTVEGGITGSGLLRKTGTGTLFLEGSKGYSGETRVEQGVLKGEAGTGLAGEINISSGAKVCFDQLSAATFSGTLSGLGSIEKKGAATLSITQANTFSGGTKISVGTLRITDKDALGSGIVTIDSGATFELDGSFSFTPGVLLSTGTGSVRVPSGETATISGVVTGPGKLQKTEAGKLILKGENKYSGGTIIAGGTLEGDTTSLQGDIDVSGNSLVFNQSGSGTYSGSLTGVGSLRFEGGGTFTVSKGGSFSGATTLTSAHVIMTGSLGSSSITVGAGSTLSGNGTIGKTDVEGNISPGVDGPGTLTVNGKLNFPATTGRFVSQLTPTGVGLLSVTGEADLSMGTLQVDVVPGFYGLSVRWTILEAGSIPLDFASTDLSPLIKSAQVVYDRVSSPETVKIFAKILDPFFNFPYANANERAVGENLTAIAIADQESVDLTNVIDSMAGLSVSQINDALDQMHPAALGALSEVQVALGDQLLSSLHRMPKKHCGCDALSRFWVEPFGNWLELKHKGMQIGFDATTAGVLAGYDHQFFDFWTVGLAGAYSNTDLNWSLDRGHSCVQGGYGCIYTDFTLGRFFLGSSGYVGKDWYDTDRHIRFSSIDRRAKSTSDALDAGGQIQLAYFLGTPSFSLYPYASLDYLYLNNSSFRERGADSLNLDVNSYTSSTLFARAGGTMRFVDRNPADTFCIAPLVSFGYVLELPLHRDHYRSNFEDITIPFQTRGWNKNWQLLNLKFGLELTYKCFTLDVEYIADISPEGNSPYVNQRANGRCMWAF